jgi:hypothetical protein
MNTKVKHKSNEYNDGNQNHQMKSKGQLIIYQIHKTIQQFFPDLFERMSEIPDHRERKQYEMTELITGGIAMFLFKEGSRNAMNNDRKEQKFANNYQRLFKLKLPHMDTVDDLFSLLNEEELEKLKASLVAGLIEQKVIRKFKFLGKSYIIAIDGTGISSYDYQHCDCCLKKISKTGTVSYFHNVLEAKLVTSNGLSISLATEWISNEDKSEFDKQDCELNAFKRLALKIKEFFPRLPILITADGLYPNQYFFEICYSYAWNFIVTFQDKTLKALQEEIAWLKIKISNIRTIVRVEKNNRITLNYRYLNDLDYKGYKLSWVECEEKSVNTKTGIETITKFIHLTNVQVDHKIYSQVSDTGRLRWKIENEGFNSQKNEGYALEHKYSRVSFLAMKNNYQCLQIAHMINQLVLKSKTISELFKENHKFTVSKLWERLKSFMIEMFLDDSEIQLLHKKQFQIRIT